ncbi:MBL fold metallo-hydrolase [Streptomyces virginiae]|uniref:MBL fold metallo-hydrolase n=1 Tax=Streptomyces virginiae TaxID=1961 RepID=UPI003F53F98E
MIRDERPVPEPVLLDREIPLYARGLAVPEAPPTPVDRELEDGDALGFGDRAYVVHAAGHTDGSIGIHLPRHGVLFTGDCVAAVGPLMPGASNVDRVRAVGSCRRLAGLEPSVACFGHGDPLTADTASALAEAAAETPA